MGWVVACGVEIEGKKADGESIWLRKDNTVETGG
jgi:hypothetical protein